MAGPTSPGDRGNELAPRDQARVDYLSAMLEDELDRTPSTPLADLDDADRAELDELRTLLADETLWVEPPADLEESIVGLISAEAAARGSDDELAEPAVAAPPAADSAPVDAPAVDDERDTIAGFADGPVDLAAARERRIARDAERGPGAPRGAPR